MAIKLKTTYRWTFTVNEITVGIIELVDRSGSFEIDKLGVDPNNRKQGIASSLMKTAIEFWKQTGTNDLRLTAVPATYEKGTIIPRQGTITDSERDELIKFYEGFGFKLETADCGIMKLTNA